MFNESVDQIFDLFESEGLEIYIVGGAVRNHFLQAPIGDIDFAVSCPPDQTIDILKTHHITAIPTGYDHGTITALIDHIGYEITSFRKDIETDGRHAVTEFGGSLLDDAKRRDFTINALYVNRRGALIDPLGVKADLDARILRFVGDAKARISEDYLRILRLFRLKAQYDLHISSDALTATAALKSGLQNISRERIGAEMRKWLGGRFAATALDLASQTGVLPLILEHTNLTRFQAWQIYLDNNTLERNWMVALSVLSEDIPKNSWRLSKKETRDIGLLHDAMKAPFPPLEMGERFGAFAGFWGLHYHAFQNDKTLTQDALNAVTIGASLECPIDGRDLQDLGFHGPAIGENLQRAKAAWRASEYTLDKAALKAFLEPNS